jgi:hypothetical protein
MMITVLYQNDADDNDFFTSPGFGCGRESEELSSSSVLVTSSTLGKRRSIEEQQPTRDGATSTQTKNTRNLTSINSGFLAGLFDDVSKINVLNQLKLGGSHDSTTEVGKEAIKSSKIAKRNSYSIDANHRQVTSKTRNPTPEFRTISPSSRSIHIPGTELDPLHLLGPLSSTSTINNAARPAKKSRLSMIKVPSLTGLQQMDTVSYRNSTELPSTFQAQGRELLSSFVSRPESGLHDHAIGDTLQKTQTSESSLSRLFSQVSFLDSQFFNIHSNPAKLAMSRLAKATTSNKFPILPCTISESSCDKLRRRSCATLVAANRTASSSSFDESFGWFVDTDDNNCGTIDDRRPTSPYADGTPLFDHHGIFANDKTSDLAFQAPTAPKGRSIQGDAEIEWAQAADTVDSVLGGIF